MAKIKYSKSRGLKKVIKESKPVPSVAGESYESIHPLVCRQILQKRKEYARAEKEAEIIIAFQNPIPDSAPLKRARKLK